MVATSASLVELFEVLAEPEAEPEVGRVAVEAMPGQRVDLLSLATAAADGAHEISYELSDLTASGSVVRICRSSTESPQCLRKTAKKRETLRVSERGKSGESLKVMASTILVLRSLLIEI